MPDSITRGNESARKRAATAGRLTYQHTVTDSWPACTVCGTPLRPNVGSHYRGCGCAGVRWWCGYDGWRRVEAEEATTGG